MCLVPYSSVLPLAGDTQETHFRDMGTEMATQFLACAPSSAIRPKRRCPNTSWLQKGSVQIVGGKKSQKELLPKAGKSKGKEKQPEVKPSLLLPCPHRQQMNCRSLSEAPSTGCGYQGRLSDLILLTVWSRWRIMALVLVKSLTRRLQYHLFWHHSPVCPGSHPQVLCSAICRPFLSQTQWS